MRASRRWQLLVGAVVAVLMAAFPFAQRRGPGGQGPEGLQFRFVGPAVGNRVASIAGVPNDPLTYYAGAASGGVWKTTDGGLRWNPVADGIDVAAIGALAVAPSDPKIVYAGTGEAWAIRDIDVAGDGVYKSIDAGATWTHTPGLEATGRIGRILVHPTNPNIAFACAVGRMTGPQKERGVFRTTDGGQHWEQVLLVDEKTGCSGLTMDAHDPNVLFAGTWQVEMHTWAMFSGGPGSGIYVSRDGGTTWKKVENAGLPKPPVGKIDVAIAPTDSKRVYALIQTKDQGSLWRSDDGGQTWRNVNWQRGLIGRAGYYIHLAVSPASADEVMVANSSFWVSTDGGQTFTTRPYGGDTHDIWWDPNNADRFVVTDDGGLNIVTRRGGNAITNRVTLPIGQNYHVAVDNQVPYWVYSNMQDDGTMRGPSTGAEAGGGGRGGNVWDHGLGGCESGFTIPDPEDPTIVWASCYGNKLTRYDAKTKTARSVAPWMITLDSAPNESKYRCHWTAPLVVDPFDHNSVYYGCQVIFKTSNGGQSWSVISPDLSTQDPTRIVSSGGIVADNLGQFAPEVVFAIAPSEIQKGLIWAGTNDGKVWYTADGGAKWNDVTRNVGMPVWGTITKIEPSHFDPGTAYIAVDYHLMDNRDPFLFKTTDFGKTWTKISDGLPGGHPLSYVRAVAEDPNKKGLLFAGTGHGFFYSLDDGGHWTQLKAGLPPAPVTWIVVQKQFRDVVVSTYGRGIYVLDDITPLEQMGSSATDGGGPVQLFAPRQTFRFARGGRAVINAALKDAPKASVQIDVTDSSGATVRHLEVPGRAGLNRFSWDLRYDPPTLVALRTTPPEDPHIWEEPRFRNAETRPVTHWGMAQAQVGPMAAPGSYNVRLTVDGQSQTTRLELVKDPRFASTQADLEASVKLGLRIRDAINDTSRMVNQMEIWRRQLEDAQKDLRSQAGIENLQNAVFDAHKRITAVEDKLLEPAMRLSDDKYFVQAYHVYTNLIWLNGEVGPGAGDVAGGTDYRPTDTSVAVLDTIEKDLNAARADYDALVKTQIPAFNKAVAGTAVKPLAPPK